MNFTNRSYERELLDAPSIPFEDLLINLRELDTINTYLGGHQATLRGIGHFLSPGTKSGTISVAEIGCGGGDNLAVIHNYLESRNQAHRLTGIDIKAECIRYAAQARPEPVDWICSDYRTVDWASGKPDIIFSSLFCHHFTNEELIGQLIWLRENSRLGFFINDLHRHPLAYYSIGLLTGLFSKSYLVKNDAPLSVRRGFKKKEWLSFLTDAGISNAVISWEWAFRHLIVVKNEH